MTFLTIEHVTAILMALIAVSAVAMVRVVDLFALVALTGIYSALLAAAFAVLAAVDVAFTEAVVGTSIATVFFMGLMRWINPSRLTRRPRPRRALAAAIAVALGAVLVYGIHALPEFGDPQAPATLHISPEYGERAMADMKTPNVVTAVLADYRSFDTLIETAVVLTAALACLLILGRQHDRPARVRSGAA